MDVEIKFEPEGRSGIVATGSYLFDAAKRLGVNLEAECDRRGECDSCQLKILSGKNILSEPTKAEMEVLKAEQIINGLRLACQTKIVEQGELTVMNEKKKEPEKTEEQKAEEARKKIVEDFRKYFEKLPLEQKISELVDLESVAFGETVSYVMNSPYTLADKVMDVMSGFGLKMDRENKRHKRPEEHKTEEQNDDKDSEKKEPTAKKKPSRAKKKEDKPEQENEENKDSKQSEK